MYEVYGYAAPVKKRVRDHPLHLQKEDQGLNFLFELFPI